MLYIYIYIYIPTNIMDLRVFDSSIILCLRGGIPRPMGNSPESLSQAILVGIIHVSREIVRINDHWKHRQ